MPLASPRGDWNFYYEDRVIAPGEAKPRGDWQVVTPGYFEALGVPVVDGRAFAEEDDAASNLVLIVNRALAERYWPSSSPIGRRVRLGGNDDNPFASIIGIVENIRHQTLASAPVPELYLPQAQASRIMGRGEFRHVFFLTRTDSAPEALVPLLRAEVRALDADVPVAEFRTMSDVRNASLAVSRFATSLLSTFAIVALILGAVGVFGVLSHIVALRTREIGIRVAVGASSSNVTRLVVGQGLRLAAIGVTLGILVSVGFHQTLSSLLYGISPRDPLTYAAVSGLLVFVAGAAAYLPARRATRVDPIQILRVE